MSTLNNRVQYLVCWHVARLPAKISTPLFIRIRSRPTSKGTDKPQKWHHRAVKDTCLDRLDLLRSVDIVYNEPWYDSLPSARTLELYIPLGWHCFALERWPAPSSPQCAGSCCPRVWRQVSLTAQKWMAAGVCVPNPRMSVGRSTVTEHLVNLPQKW